MTYLDDVSPFVWRLKTLIVSFKKIISRFLNSFRFFHFIAPQTFVDFNWNSLPTWLLSNFVLLQYSYFPAFYFVYYTRLLLHLRICSHQILSSYFVYWDSKKITLHFICQGFTLLCHRLSFWAVQYDWLHYSFVYSSF